jgi:Secretion system C-terminal sorting domain/FG-GAP repeat
MRQILLLIFLMPFIFYGQIQIGQDIPSAGQYDIFGHSVSLSSDASIVAVGAPYNDENGIDSGKVQVYKNISGVWTQIGNDINGETAGDWSGYSISLSSNGNIIAIGAFRNSGSNMQSGQVRVYENISGVWTQIGNDIDGEDVGDYSGWSVSLSSSGNIVAIGGLFNNNSSGTDSGQVRVYENISGVWTQIGNDIDGQMAYENSGYSVSLSSSGNIVAIGAPSNSEIRPNSGQVRIYENISGVWTQIGNDINGDVDFNQLGYSISLSSDGSIVAIGVPTKSGIDNGKGFVRVFKNISGIWTQIGNDIIGEAINDLSGESVTLSSDGSIVAIGANYNYGGAYRSGHVRVYRNILDVWTKIGSDIDGQSTYDYFGNSIDLSSNGNILAIGVPRNYGYARIYDLSAVLSTESFRKDYFTMYPNPVKNILNIEINNGLELKQVNIYNSLSQYLYSTKELKIDTNNLKSGMYFIEIVTDKGKSAKKVILE